MVLDILQIFTAGWRSWRNQNRKVLWNVENLEVRLRVKLMILGVDKMIDNLDACTLPVLSDMLHFMSATYLKSNLWTSGSLVTAVLPLAWSSSLKLLIL